MHKRIKRCCYPAYELIKVGRGTHLKLYTGKLKNLFLEKKEEKKEKYYRAWCF